MASQKPVSAPRVGLYVRQSVKVDEGIEQQLEECKTYAEAPSRQWIVVDVYSDNQTSASVERGPKSEWARMLRDVDAGVIDTILVVAVDRLLRRTIDVVEVTSPKRNVRVVTIRGGIDTGDPANFGKFILSLFVLVAEQEIEIKKARALPYKMDRRANGTPEPGRAPFGYSWIPKLERKNLYERFRLDPVAANTVKFIFDEALAAEKLSIGALIGSLKEEGHEPPNGIRWNPSTVRRILLSPFYAGLVPPVIPVKDRKLGTTGKPVTFRAELIDLDKCTAGNWKAIVTEDRLRAVRAKLLNDPGRFQNGGSTQKKWLLSGLARCAICGAVVRGATTKEKYRGWRCPNGHFQRRADVIEKYIIDVTLDRLSEPDAVTLLAPPPPDVDVPALHARQAALRAKRDEYLKLVGTYSAEQIQGYTAEIDSELATIDTALAAVMKADPLAAIITAEDVRAHWDALTMSRKRDVISAILTPYIDTVGKGKRVHTNEDAADNVMIIWNNPNKKSKHLALPILVNEAGIYGLHPNLSDAAKTKLSKSLN